MPSITTVHESLPYIDPEPSADERTAAETLIRLERAAVPDDPHHALLPPAPQPRFSALMQAELARLASSPDPLAPAPTAAIDLARYEAPDDAACGDDDGRQRSLDRACAALTYLSGRRQQLALLDGHGRNAWLVANWRLEADVGRLEAALRATRRDLDLLTLHRQRLQADAAAEIKALDETWKSGIAKVLHTELAAERLRRDLVEAMRARSPP